MLHIHCSTNRHAGQDKTTLTERDAPRYNGGNIMRLAAGAARSRLFYCQAGAPANTVCQTATNLLLLDMGAACIRENAPTTVSAPALRRAAASRSVSPYIVTLVIIGLLFSLRLVVPTFVASQRQAILFSAQRHDVPPDVLAAVFYNEMFGQEARLLHTAIPGDSDLASAVRDSLLGIDFLTIKQLQIGVKCMAALAGANTTIGPAGIRISVGREIESETTIAGSRHQLTGLAERPSLIADLMSPSTAMEYLAANLQRGMRRAAPEQAGDWTVSARWHNTGVISDRPDVPRPVWNKGSRYIARVQTFQPEVRLLLDLPLTLPVQRVHVPDPQNVAVATMPGGQRQAATHGATQ
jgi:hypothetical protein